MKFKRGKSKKISWKKSGACDDIDAFLVEKREEEVRGDDPNDNSLFFFDTKQQLDVAAATSADVVDTSAGVVVGPVDVRKLRCFAGIYRNPSKVKDPIVKRNIRTKKKLPAAKKSKYVTGHPHQQPPPLPQPESSTANGYDLWGGAAPSAAARRSRKRPVYTTSLVPAIEPPPAGLSVNPSFRDHQDLLRDANNCAAAEAAKKKKGPQQKKFAPEMKPEADLKEEDPDDEDTEHTTATTATKPRPVLKTKSQRRRAGELREETRVRRAEKDRRAREGEVFKIKKMKRQMELEEVARVARSKARRAKVEERNRIGVKELSKFKFTEPLPQVTLRAELGKRLKDFKGLNQDLLSDRFKSLQKRNVIEVRIKSKQTRKHRGKKYVRASDKMDWEKTGEWNGVKLPGLLDTKQK